MKTFKEILSLRSRFSPGLTAQKFLASILLAFLLSCNNEQRADIRPADQQSFIGIVKGLKEQAEKISLTDPNRALIIDEGVKHVKKYIVDTLKSRFDGWDVRVLDNKKTDPNEGETRITFGMSIDDFNLEETARFKSIVFRETLSNVQPPLREKLQKLKVGDHIKISGSFVTRDKKIDIDPYNEKEYRLSKNIFTNPELRVDIADVLPVEN